MIDGEVASARPVQELLDRAESYRLRGCYAKADGLLRRAFARAERTFGGAHGTVAAVLNDLAVLCKYRGRYSEAARLYRRVRTILEKAPARPLVLATLYHNLGGLEHARGCSARGESFARHAVTLRTEVLGPDHPQVAADQSALAALLDAQGKYDEAEVLYGRALMVFARAYGPTDLEVAVVLNNLAALYQATGRAAAAEPLYRRTLQIKTKHLGLRHPDIALTLNNLAVLCKSLGRLDEAETLYRQALILFDETLGRQHPHAATCRSNLRRLIASRGKKSGQRLSG